MISTSIRATWSRACCSALAIAALTASAASADLRTSRVSLDRAAQAGSVVAALQPVDANTYTARLIHGDGTPVTEQIAISDSEGRMIQRVVPTAEGLIRIAGQSGQKFGVLLPGSDLTTNGSTLSGGIALTDDVVSVIDVVVFGPSAGATDVVHSAPGIRGSFTGLNLDQTGLNPGMVVNQGGATCDGAVVIAVGGSDSGTTVGSSADNTGANFCGTAYTGGSPLVWYEVTGNGNRLTAETCPSAPFDSKLWVFRQCGTPCSGATLTCLGGNDDACGGGLNFQSRVAWDSVAGTTYKIAIGGFGGAAGAYTLNVLNGAPSANAQICPLPTGSCCITSPAPYSQNEVPVSCQIENEPDCVALGGTYNGDDVPCVTGDITFAEYDDTPVPAVPIPDGTGPLPSPGPSVIRTITVAGTSVVADVNVEVDVQHPFNADLNIFIHHGAGSVRIWNNVCGNANLHYTSDDEGTVNLCVPIGTGQADNDGDGFNSDSPDVAPSDVFPVDTEFLTEMDGLPCEGDWDFEILDNWVAITGSLQHWGLELTCLANPVNACPDAVCDGGGGGCADPSGHTLLCHIPPGNPDNAHEIVVGNAAVPAHLAHGDLCGPCAAP